MQVIGNSENIKEACKKAFSFAPGAFPVCIVGEEGTGRAHFARYIHKNSSREAENFVIFDAVKPKEIEKELFGSARTTILGKLELKEGAIGIAESGTLIIKNAHAIPSDLQLQLLATVELGGYKPVNAPETVKSSCRFIFAFPSSPIKLSQEKKLVPELGELLSKREIALLPLRKRVQDIEELAEYFCKKWCVELNIAQKTFTKNAVKLLKKNPWYANTAELQSVIMNSVIGGTSNEIDAQHLMLKIDGNWGNYINTAIDQLSIEDIIERKLNQFLLRLGRYEALGLHSAIVERVERPLIRLVMEKTGNNQMKAARLLGLNRNTLRAKLQKLEILND